MELIKRFSKKGALVADFFAGSGASREAAMRVNRNWIGCDVDPIVFPACKQRLLNYFSSNIRLGLVSPPGTVSERLMRLIPIDADRFRQLEQTLLQGPDYWLNTPPYIDLSRSDSILEQDKTGNGDMCYVAESQVPEIRSQDGLSKGVFVSKPIKKGTVIGSHWEEIRRCLLGDNVPRDVRQNPNLLHFKHPKFQGTAFLYIVLNHDCLVRYLNCARVPGSGKTVNDELLNAEFSLIFNFDAPKRRWFTDAICSGKFEEIKCSHNLCVVRAVRNIEPEEELFADYGRNYREFGVKGMIVVTIMRMMILSFKSKYIIKIWNIVFQYVYS